MAKRRSELSGNGGTVEITKHFRRLNRFRNHQITKLFYFRAEYIAVSFTAS